MTNEEAIEVMNGDLKNEYRHLLFYLRSTALVKGLHRQHLKEWLAGQAASELGHCQAFSEKVVALGGVPTTPDIPDPALCELRDPKDILEEACRMEQEVVDNYALRIDQIRELGNAQGTYLGLFYEEQLEDSHEDLDELKEMLRDL